jgi:hypothetical protein
MEILGYIGFAVLIFLAATWTIGVRTQFDAGTGTVIGAILFVASALVLTISDVSKLHLNPCVHGEKPMQRVDYIV